MKKLILILLLLAWTTLAQAANIGQFLWQSRGTFVLNARGQIIAQAKNSIQAERVVKAHNAELFRIFLEVRPL
jgi:hypothetical protein